MTMAESSTDELMSGTTNEWTAPGGRRWAPTDFVDVTHAEKPGSDGVALCGARPPMRPDGTPFPLPQLVGAMVCADCMDRVG